MSHKVGSSRLVTGSNSYLEFDLHARGDSGALVQVYGTCHIRAVATKIKPTGATSRRLCSERWGFLTLSSLYENVSRCV
jgi:hypothetical protein